MNEHDARILGPKTRPVKDRAVLAEFARSHHWCQVCGKPGPFTIAHIIGGRSGRSDEPCNLVALCWIPCHSAYDGQYIQLRPNSPPRITLGMMLWAKLRAGELTEADLERLTALHGKKLPEPEPLPAYYETRWASNRRAA